MGGCTALSYLPFRPVPFVACRPFVLTRFGNLVSFSPFSRLPHPQDMMCVIGKTPSAQIARDVNSRRIGSNRVITVPAEGGQEIKKKKNQEQARWQRLVSPTRPFQGIDDDVQDHFGVAILRFSNGKCFVGSAVNQKHDGQPRWSTIHSEVLLRGAIIDQVGRQREIDPEITYQVS